MSNEIIYVWGTQITLESNGASVSNGSIALADDTSYTTSDGGDFPDGKFVLRVQFGTTTGIENKLITLVARELSVDGANSCPAPTATYLEKTIGTFVLSSAADQYLTTFCFDLPKSANYYIYNASGQTISAGWTLKITPRSYKPAV